MIGRTATHTASNEALLHRNKRTDFSTAAAVSTEFLFDCEALPLVIRPAVPKLNLVNWASENREFVDDSLLDYGAILFRGFGVANIETFTSFAHATSSGGLLDYRYGSVPRRRIGNGVYTSIECPAGRTIPLHNEMSDSLTWPMKMWLCCLKPAPGGGATSIADSANVFDRIDPEIRDSFMSNGVSYVRNYRPGLDPSYRQVFGGSAPEEIEAVCREAGIEFEWQANGRLKTRQNCQAIAVHPGTGRIVWFNQAHLLHGSTLDREVPPQLLAALGEEGLPRNAYYGDGDRKSTRLNSSHVSNSYAVLCLKKKVVGGVLENAVMIGGRAALGWLAFFIYVLSAVCLIRSQHTGKAPRFAKTPAWPRPRFRVV